MRKDVHVARHIVNSTLTSTWLQYLGTDEFLALLATELLLSFLFTIASTKARHLI